MKTSQLFTGITKATLCSLAMILIKNVGNIVQEKNNSYPPPPPPPPPEHNSSRARTINEVI